MKKAVLNTTPKVTPAAQISPGVQKQDNTDVPSPDAEESQVEGTYDLFPDYSFAYPPGEDSFFGDEFNFGDPSSQIDWFSMSKPYFDRAVPQLRHGDFEAIEARWMDTFRLSQTLGFDLSTATWISNQLTPMAIDSALQGDFPTAFELSNQELGVSPTMVGGTIANFKLEVGEPDDPLEREADSVAERVMRSEETFLQKKCASCEQEEKVQRQSEEEEELQMKPLVQRKISSDKNTITTPWIEQQIHSKIGNGQKLPEQTRSFMESGVGANFQNVNVHTDSTSVQMNRELGAKAFTVGNDIFFNAGQYSPETGEGKRLLAHELTHTVQQGSSEAIQRDGEGSVPSPDPEPTASESSSSGSDPLARMVGRLVRDQLSDSSMRGHIRSLGEQLQGLAVEGTGEPTDQPRGSAERLSALEVAHAFESTADQILADEAFQALRQNLIRILSSSDAAVLVAGLAAGLVAFLADVNVAGSPEGEIADSGFSLGGSFDLGSLQDLNFNELKIMAQYATEHFQVRLEGGVERGEAPEGAEDEEGPIIGTGSGRIRFGNEISNLTGRLSLNSAGELVLGADLSLGHQFSGGNRLVLSTEIEHQQQLGPVEEAESTTTISPELSGRFRFRGGSSVRLGSSLEFTLDEGLTGARGFVEFEQDRINLRIEGRMNGLPEEASIRPQTEMLVQGFVTFYY